MYGTSPTREILFVDDLFTGSEWTQEPTNERSPIVPFAASVAELEAHPPAPVRGPKSELVTQAIANIDLAGPEIPTPGLPVAMDGSASATLEGSDGPVTVAPGAFGNNYSYGVQAVLEPSPAVAQEYYDSSAAAAPAVDFAVPEPLPAPIRTLAAEIVSGATTEEAKAEAIQDFLLTHFRYQLPKTVPATQTAGYSALMSFLFTTRTGYCQQFASSFAVLARIDGLASRVVVGFLPTAEKHGSWVVTGLQTHAWPQVYFPGTGWVDFEPTPGAGSPAVPRHPDDHRGRRDDDYYGRWAHRIVLAGPQSSATEGRGDGKLVQLSDRAVHPVAARRRHWPQRFGRRCRCAPGAPGGGAPVDHRRPARAARPRPADP